MIIKIKVNEKTGKFEGAWITDAPQKAEAQTATAKPETVEAETIEAETVEAETVQAEEVIPELPPCTAADVRAAMDSTRKRIEGDDYKHNPRSDGYRTWHRPLTAAFKRIAAKYGASRPSALPDDKSRRGFVLECEALTTESGELDQDLPF